MSPSAAPAACRVVLGALVLGALGSAGPAGAATFYATEVVASVPGSPTQPGFGDAAEALGAPSGRGSGAGSAAGEGSTSVYNLGVGGSITLGFDELVGDARTGRVIVDDPGADFIVFENAFYAAGDASRSFAELVFVEVSSNGTDFARFAHDSRTPSTVSPFGTVNPANVTGFAGVTPVYANPEANPSIDPFDPAEAGGDAFDLGALAGDPLVAAGKLDLGAVRLVRLIDVIGDGRLRDADSPIYDPYGAGNGGADIDALAVIHGAAAAPVPEPATAAALGLVLGGLALSRRRRRR